MERDERVEAQKGSFSVWEAGAYRKWKWWGPSRPVKERDTPR